MIEKLLNIVFPRKCPFCSKTLRDDCPVCKNCMNILPLTKNMKCCKICGIPLMSEYSYDICPRCNKQGFKPEYVYVPLVYAGRAKHAVISLKYYDHPSYAEAFAFLIADRILNSERAYDIDFVTYMPQNTKTYFSRGYNQAKLIAQKLAKLLNLPCVKTIVRTNGGRRQATLSGYERKKNVRKCYFEGKESLRGNALLVDDVMTTGETMFYCSLLLKRMGCNKVYGAAALVKSEDIIYEYQK